LATAWMAVAAAAQQVPGLLGLILAGRGQVDVDPAREQVLAVPLALTMTE